ncbi:MAG TPA: hypothetical protein VG186_10545 [Solirubrobacteraceae bacterium]|jgi:hypothetical protein|nr:hypothetical protein [Solirubrobacteraceae bacterium]
MPIELTATQAQKVATLADVYVAPAGGENQYRVTADGEVVESAE